MSIRLGYQIPSFSYPGGVGDIFPTVVAQAQEAERSGFDTVFVMDHFYQLPNIGSPDEPMLEAYTTLGALAAATSKIKLSTLVTGNTYRNPAMLAKVVTTLDVISGGRAVLGIGAGWYELEHRQMGYEFGTFTERFERLTEALDIIEPMLRGSHPEHEGKWYSAVGTLNEPRIRDDLPIMLGGGGEKKTFGLAARYASHLNIICGASELPTKLEAVQARCDEVGRDRESLETSFLAFVMTDPDADAARSMQLDYAASLGLDLSSDDPRAAVLRDRMFVGTPDDVAQQIRDRVLDTGVDGIIINMVRNGYVPGMVGLAGEAIAKVL
ncbi:LLM class F420-dependent oxidoreductase [Gordonia jinhuaensis]|uniref:Luciferase-like oxidoreductase n=1 Tax=Gordonia jinhuaensis TaxID=1517702 RepID=A0A916WTD4_9ACTN|nr:LLM class F420-dependent oxidoreductase [Gordonia jinhuaensis]GGB28054.1 putative luciferase-like oxidoreductase [Gordonia jinhuaensis]